MWKPMRDSRASTSGNSELLSVHIMFPKESSSWRRSFRIWNRGPCLWTGMSPSSLNFQDLDRFVMVSIDDIMVYSRSEEEHEDHLHLVLQKLWDHKLYAKLSRCEFWLKQVAFLCHIILKGGKFVDKSKVQYVLSWNAPTSIGDIQSFLGLAGYYWRFIEGFSKISKPMTELLKKDKKFKWMPVCEASF
jgi:hypothetical protein